MPKGAGKGTLVSNSSNLLKKLLISENQGIVFTQKVFLNLNYIKMSISRGWTSRIKLFMKKPLLYISIFVFALGCSSGDEEKVDTRTVFKYNDMAGVSTLDPAGAYNFENILAVNQLYTGLVEMDDSLKIRPSIAKSWEISSDGLTYTFHLHTDVAFHDHEYFENGVGRKVTAKDFIYSSAYKIPKFQRQLLCFLMLMIEKHLKHPTILHLLFI